jgi:hypothetical protein
MSLALLIWFAIPIGIYTIRFEQKSKDKYNALFEDFYQKILNDERLNREEKMERLEELLNRNSYTIVEHTSNRIVGERKILSLGWIILTLGLIYIGVIFYLIYYYFIQKPHRLIYEI